MKNKLKLMYKDFLDRLENDKSIEELQDYLSGKTRIDHRIGTPEQKKEILEVIIPKIIEQQNREDDEYTKLWYNPPLFRLAYIYCLNNRIPLCKIFYIAKEIIDRIHKDNQESLPQQFKEYYRQEKDVELSDIEGIKKILKRIK